MGDFTGTTGNDGWTGTDSGETAHGGGGADTLDGAGGNDSLYGEGEGDLLTGGAGNDLLEGGEGNDTLVGGPGDDLMNGGNGDDELVVSTDSSGHFDISPGDRFAGGAGTDTLVLTGNSSVELVLDPVIFAADIERISAYPATLVAGAARLNGFQYLDALAIRATTAGSFVVSTNFRVDQFVLSDFGNSVDLTGRGSFPARVLSRVTGGAGADNITGSSDSDQISGGGGNDVIHAGGGADEISGGTGIDWVDGGAGFDRLVIDAGDQVEAGDRFTGGADMDTLAISTATVVDLSLATVDADIERLEAFGMVKLTIAQFSHFTSMNATSLTFADGGAVDLSSLTAGNIVLSAFGNQVVLGGRGPYSVTGGAGADRIDATANIFSGSFSGGGGDDVVLGTAADDTFNGGAGADRIEGRAGGDNLDGGTGADQLIGGIGDDIYIVDDLGDVVIELAGDGADRVLAWSSYALPAAAAVERLEAIDNSSTNALDLTGNGFANLLFGNAGANRLDGGGGDDVMTGYEGDDVYIVDSAGDVVQEFAGAGNDTVITSASFTIGGYWNIETLRTADPSSTAPLQLGGSLSNNHIIGNAGANVIDGGDGDDILEGGLGNDRLFAGLGIDQLLGGQGDDGLSFGGSFGAGDAADGGAGTDTLALQGFYSTTLTDVSNIEVLLVASGSDTRFGSTQNANDFYNLRSVDSNVAAGAGLTVIASDLKKSETLQFDGSAESNGYFRIFAGRGVDTLTGGAGDDGFFFGAEGNLTGADRIVGGAGTDTIALRGNYGGSGAVAFQNASFSGIELLTFLSGHTNEYGGAIVASGFDYDVTLADGNLAAGGLLQVIAGNLRADESLRFDGRSENDGNLTIIAGAGDDILFGGQGNDSLYGGLGSDQLNGQLGVDTYVYRSVAESSAGAPDTIFWNGGGHKIDLSFIDANANTAGVNEAFTYIGANAFSHTAGELRVAHPGGWIVEADVNGDGIADLVINLVGPVGPAANEFVL